jgi:crossover junction endodeoxyribonuclease RusA
MIHRLDLPYPISANRYWQTRVFQSKATGHFSVQTYVTPEARAYREEIKRIALAAGIRKPLLGRVELACCLYPHRPVDYRTRMRKLGAAWDDSVRCIDLGNCEKVMSDALQGVVFEDDAWLWQITLRRMEPDDGGERLTVWVRNLPMAAPEQLAIAAPPALLTARQVADVASGMLPPDAALCFGVDCPCRGTCARYLAIDSDSEPASFIESCQTGASFPLYVDTSQASETA